MPRARWVVVGAIALSAGLLAVRGAAVHSRSRQFVVQSANPALPSLGRSLAGADPKLVFLEPGPVAVSCERIKEALLRELGLPDRWQGKVQVRIRPAPAATEPIQVTCVHYADGWRYGIDLPDQLEPMALVRAVVQVLLLEIANHQPGPQPPEIPVLLVEGLASNLADGIGADLVIEPNALQTRVGANWGQLQPSTRNLRPAEHVRQLRDYLRANLPMTFSELSLPSPEQLRGEGFSRYRACAKLFVSELLHLPEGRQALARMLALLTQTHNWQTAFLQAFASRFPRLLEVEKWWALTLAGFLGRDEAYAWSRGVSLRQLDHALTVTVETQAAQASLPQRSQVSLAQIIAEWDYAQQLPLLRAEINQLAALQTSLAPDVAPLVSNYISVLETYLEQKARNITDNSAKGQAPLTRSLVVRDTLRRLEELERQRAKLRP